MSTADRRDPCRDEEAEPRDARKQNLPGQSSIDYRLGTHGTFLEGMLRRLPYVQVPQDEGSTAPLAKLLTQAKDDPAIALLDAWAVVEDVLTFYQERLANEGFLRTAVDQRSVRELAGMIGYQPAPGVAASVRLAFDVEDAQGAPGKAVVPAGTRVLSLPENGNLPQAFETSATVEVRAEWNAMRPRLTRPANPESRHLWIEGLGLRLSPGDWVITERGASPPLVRRILKVEVEQKERRTHLVLEAVPSTNNKVTAAPTQTNPKTISDVHDMLSEPELRALIEQRSWNADHCDKHLRTRTSEPRTIKVLGQHLAFFGHNAPGHDGEKSIWVSSRGLPLAAGDGQGACVLEREAEQLSIGQHIIITSSSEDDQITDEHVGPTEENEDDDDEKALHMTFAFREPGSLATPGGSSNPDDLDFHGGASPPRTEIKTLANGPALYRIVEITNGPRVDYGMATKATRLCLVRRPTHRDKEAEPPATPSFHFRRAKASVGEQLFDLAPERRTDPLSAGATKIQLDGYVAGLRAGQTVVLSGERKDLRGVTFIEEHVLDRIEHYIQPHGVWTTLHLASKLQHDYIRETVRINGNVVEATHGETVQEVLGSGDSAVANQKFRLRRGPLTHVPSPNGLGAKSTLEIRVDGVTWTQHESLYELGPNDRGYVVDIDDKGAARVVFGDGTHGALLPTGIDNVEATYRVGIGLAGEVGPGKLMLLQQRPVGVRGVTNPRAATGAEDSEPRDRVRANAPFTVRTLGRVVSATDYEDFARAFAGVGKVKATRLWRGDREIVHLSVAGANGMPAGDDLRQRLTEALRQCSDPSQRFQVDGYTPGLFELKVAVGVATERRPEDVLAAVALALRAGYAFDARELAQDVHQSELVVLVQRVPGVLACRLERLRRSPPQFSSTTVQPVLRALPARRNENGGVSPAELLLLRSDGLQVVQLEEAP